MGHDLSGFRNGPADQSRSVLSEFKPFLARIDTAFQKAKAPAKRELAGKWVMIGFVVTQAFRGSGKEIHIDCNGIKRDGKLEWMLRFFGMPDGSLGVDQARSGTSQKREKSVLRPAGPLSWSRTTRVMR
jgi:hypothetical protein